MNQCYHLKQTVRGKLVKIVIITLAPGITNYPIGVGINANGEVTIADNHNNFNLTVFSQDGQVSLLRNM
jgi:hypothetical protein